MKWFNDVTAFVFLGTAVAVGAGAGQYRSVVFLSFIETESVFYICRDAKNDWF